MIRLGLSKVKREAVRQDLTRDKLIDLLVRRNLTRDQVGKSYGISKNLVNRLVKEHGIDVRFERANFSYNPSKVNRVLSSYTHGSGKVSFRKDYMGMW